MRSRGAVACKTGTAEFGGANEQGYRKTHGWFTAFLQLPEAVTAVAGEGNKDTSFLPEFDQVTTVSDEELHRLWLLRVRQHGFPKNVSITVLVESDEQVEFREGSRDAAPVAQQIVQWMTTLP
jgi:cell division protein FtsI/penicillin-binding protein 2